MICLFTCGILQNLTKPLTCVRLLTFCRWHEPKDKNQNKLRLGLGLLLSSKFEYCQFWIPRAHFRIVTGETSTNSRKKLGWKVENICGTSFYFETTPPFELVLQQTKFKFKNESVNQVRNFGRCCWVTFKMRKAVSKFCFFMMMVVTGHSPSLFRNMLG